MRSTGKYEPRTFPDPGEQFGTPRWISGAPRQLPVMAQRNALLAAFHRAPHHGDPHGEPSGSPMKKPALERGQLSPAGAPIPSLAPCRLRRQNGQPSHWQPDTISCGTPRAIPDRTPQDIGTTPGQGKPPDVVSAQPTQDIPQAPPIYGSPQVTPHFRRRKMQEAQKKYEGQIRFGISISIVKY
ncbi:hypothetical protein ES703_77651 [subsurface metagenome]